MPKSKKPSEYQSPDDEEKHLVELTKDALAEVLGRQPTRKEIWRTHAGFKRMAFILHEHLDHIKTHGEDGCVKNKDD